MSDEFSVSDASSVVLPSSAPSMPVVDETFTIDLQSELGQQVFKSQVQLNQRSLAELLFIEMYCSEGSSIVERLIQLRPLMGGGLQNRLYKAIESVSIMDLLKQVGFNVNR